ADRQRFLDILETWNTDSGAIALKTQFLVSGGTEDRPIAVLLDAARGVWRWVGRYPPGQPTQFVHRVGALLARVRPGSLLVCDPVFLEPLRAVCPDQRVTAVGEPIAEEGGDGPAVREVLSRLEFLPADLAFLSLPSALGLRGAVDRTLSVVAQGLL